MHQAVVTLMLLLTIGAGQLEACGLATHNEIMERTILMFDPDLEPELTEMMCTHPGTADAGSLFPDLFWGLEYLTGDEYYREVGELVHGGYGSVYGENLPAEPEFEAKGPAAGTSSASPFVQMGMQMLTEGIVEVPVTISGDGCAMLGTPIVRDVESFKSLMKRLEDHLAPVR